MLARTRFVASTILVAALLTMNVGLTVEAPPSDADHYQAVAASAEWTWTAGMTSIIQSVARSGLDYQVEIVRPPQKGLFAEGRPLTIRFVKGGNQLCSFPGDYCTVFVTMNDRLFYTDHSPISDGCKLVGIDLKTGRELWKSSLQAIGPIEHSKYWNAVAVNRLDDGHVIVYGNEADGRYVEIVDVTDGKTVGHRRLPPVVP